MSFSLERLSVVASVALHAGYLASARCGWQLEVGAGGAWIAQERGLVF